jgi:hypothetical protein
MELIVHGASQNMKYGVKSALDSILNAAERSIKSHVIVRDTIGDIGANVKILIV